jgi:hypothetical protein
VGSQDVCHAQHLFKKAGLVDRRGKTDSEVKPRTFACTRYQPCLEVGVALTSTGSQLLITIARTDAREEHRRRLSILPSLPSRMWCIPICTWPEVHFQAILDYPCVNVAVSSRHPIHAGPSNPQQPPAPATAAATLTFSLTDDAPT